MNNQTKDIVQYECEKVLEDFKKRFLVKEMKVTLIARHHDDKDCFFIVTKDDLNKIIEVLKNVVKKER